MTTPRPADSPQVAPGWRAYDLTPDAVAPLLDRFISRFTPGAPDECWLWQGGKFTNGYGRISRSSYHEQGQHLLAHRVAWVAFTGRPIVNRLTIDHLCNTKLCVNPDHLEPVTLHENIRRKNERLGNVIGGGRKERPRRPRKPRTPMTPQDEEQRREHLRATSLAYYYANRERILARRRAEPRPTTQVTCDACGLVLRRDGLRRHMKRSHGAA